MEYNQTNESDFPAEMEAVQHYLGRQKWANTNAIAWVGFSLGANRILEYARQHPEWQPQLLVLLSGAGLDSSTTSNQLSTHLSCPVLLICGDQDEIFSLTDTKRLTSVLQNNGVPEELIIIPGLSHGMEPECGVVFRSIGEYCRSHLAGNWQNYRSITYWQAEGLPLWLFWIPEVSWFVGWLVWWRFGRRGDPALPRESLKRHEIALRWLAAMLATWALAETAIHLVPPRFLVSERKLGIVRRFLVQPKESTDFEFLVTQSIWQGQRLKTLLEHVELTGYNRELINWQLDDMMYRDDVLSPVITGEAGEQLNWRRLLWEEFYPRIRHESSPEDAAKIVVRHLRERVTVLGLPDLPHAIPETWLRQLTDPTGFQIIYVAALRSVGVPARLDSNHHSRGRS
jgi:hypothetical protein